MRRTAALLAVTLALAACSGDDDEAAASTTTSAAAPPTTTGEPETAEPSSSTPTPSTAAPPTTEPDAVAPDIDAPFDVSPGVEQLTITGGEPGTFVGLVPGDGPVAPMDPASDMAGGYVDDFGALVFRNLDSEVDHRLLLEEGVTEPYDVLGRDEHPDPAFFAEQRLPTEGLGYIETRDGTTLSASVWLPGAADAGPYPTVVEYSGYTPSDPESSTFAPLWNALGYAYVGVNIRGTGCSGGSFRYFEYTQSTDGYDAIETVAAQPWVQGNRVGMVGVSYPGISQLFVARTQPPNLAAITPFSVVADSAISTLYPGGILNTGFAVPWTAERMEEAQANGQQWAVDRIDAGDETCEANQLLRLQNPDLLAEITDNPDWTDEVAGEIAPRLFVDRIEVPTFVAGAWQDEQTGGHFATMLDRFTGTDRFYATVTNGLHTESIGPAVFPRLLEFLDLYVAERVPSLAVARGIAPVLSAPIFGTSEVALPAEDRFAGMSYDEALAAFESEPPIRVLFEEGAADGFPARAPMARFEAAFDAWPVPEAETEVWNLFGDGTDGGTLGWDIYGEPGDATTYVADPAGAPATFYDGSSSGIWSVDVTYDWVEGSTGTFASWSTEPLADETVVVGSGSVDLWVTSSTGDTDLEVTITELRPDGQEMYVQSGWLRASHRELDEDASTATRPVHTHRGDSGALPDSEFELVRVEVFPFAHVFRAGSRIRLIVDAPGGNRPVWEFDTIAAGEEVTIAHDVDHVSRLVLPVVSTVDAPDAYPECGALRGQPCRPDAGS